MGERRLGIVKKIPLAGLAEGWDDCYVLSASVTIGELKSIKNMSTDDMGDEEALDQMIAFVKAHIAAGKVMILDGESLSLADVEKNDVDSMSVQMVTHIFQEMTNTGAQYVDPKVSTQSIPPTSNSDVKSSEPVAPTTTS